MGRVFEVANTLGAGFLEKVYERALLRELKLRDFQRSRKLPSLSSTRTSALGNTVPASSWKTRSWSRLKCAVRLETMALTLTAFVNVLLK